MVHPFNKKTASLELAVLLCPIKAKTSVFVILRRVDYSLGIFGPETNEVAGVVGTSGDQNNFARDVGFGGQKK
ncbi:hypothetical protein [Neisseria meningitidis]|uniref:hypothetical protein n=1 Tax=Neisseria meningitidis TaxID=487 RepID=UPI001298F07E|nr:hypothetical protein [Neisseria meningitidis]